VRGVGVLHHNHMLALATGVIKFRYCCGGVGSEPFEVGRIAPSLCHHPGSVARADLRFVHVDDGVECGRVDIALIDQDRFEGTDTSCDVGEFRVIVVVVIVVVIVVVVVVMIVVVAVVLNVARHGRHSHMFGDRSPNRLFEQFRAVESTAMTRTTSAGKGRKVNLCSFCGKSANDRLRLIAGQDGSSICSECVALCVEIHLDQSWELPTSQGVASPEQLPPDLNEPGPALARIDASWRGEYISGITNEDSAVSRTACVFCSHFSSPNDDAGLIVHRGETATVVLNKYPYGSGHLLVLPHNHVSALSELDASEQDDLWSLVSKSESVLQRAYQPDGMNIGANLGRAAGAGLPEHLHVHVLPRWSADTNFMTTIGEVRVVPESLGVTLQRVRQAWLT
jgi:ATP adenylyltransferase